MLSQQASKFSIRQDLLTLNLFIYISMFVVLCILYKTIYFISSKAAFGFPGGSAVKNPPAMQKLWEMQVWSLSQGDSLEEGKVPIPVFLPGKIPCTVEPGRVRSIGLQRVRHDWSNLACMHKATFTLNKNIFTDHVVLWIWWLCIWEDNVRT